MEDEHFLWLDRCYSK